MTNATPTKTTLYDSVIPRFLFSAKGLFFARVCSLVYVCSVFTVHIMHQSNVYNHFKHSIMVSSLLLFGYLTVLSAEYVLKPAVFAVRAEFFGSFRRSLAMLGMLVILVPALTMLYVVNGIDPHILRLTDFATVSVHDFITVSVFFVVPALVLLQFLVTRLRVELKHVALLTMFIIFASLDATSLSTGDRYSAFEFTEEVLLLNTPAFLILLFINRVLSAAFMKSEIAIDEQVSKSEVFV